MKSTTSRSRLVKDSTMYKIMKARESGEKGLSLSFPSAHARESASQKERGREGELSSARVRRRERHWRERALLFTACMKLVAGRRTVRNNSHVCARARKH